jgi:hypothetical protein
VEFKEEYQVKISNRFAAFKNMDDNVESNRAWESIRVYIKTSATENVAHDLKQHKSMSDNKSSKLLDHRIADTVF